MSAGSTCVDLLLFSNRSVTITTPEPEVTFTTQSVKPRTSAHGCGVHGALLAVAVGRLNGTFIDANAATAAASTMTIATPIAAY